MKDVIKRNILLNPGPVTTSNTVKESLIVPDICHREQEFLNITQNIRNQLKSIVHAGEDYETILFTGSGTAVMDACINSVVPHDKKIAIINNGAYGLRMIQIAKCYQIPYIEISSPDNQNLDISKIEVVLEKHKDISCLAMVHHETTTGLINPLIEVGSLAKQHHCTYIVDAVSSFAGIPINIYKANIDFLFASSNKCLHGMPGIAFTICQVEKLHQTKDIQRSYYLNLFSQYQFVASTGAMRFTPAIQVIYALQKAIDEFFIEGEDNRYLRYLKNSHLLKQGLKKLGFKFYLHASCESPFMQTVHLPQNLGLSFNDIHDQLYAKGFTIYPGKTTGANTFRIANIGEIFEDDILDFLNQLELIIKK